MMPTPGNVLSLLLTCRNISGIIASSIIGNTLPIIESCRSKDMRIIFTRHGHENDSKDLGMLGKWWGDFIQYGSKEWELMKALKPNDYDGIIDKNRYNAFHGTGLMRV